MITKQDIKNAAEDYLAAKKKISELQFAYAEQICPMKIGDTFKSGNLTYIVNSHYLRDDFTWVAGGTCGDSAISFLTQEEYEQEGK